MDDLNNWQEKFEICIYVQKLLDKITDLNNSTKNLQTAIDITEVKKAIYYAKKYHGSQMRQSGEPFYSHPIEVAHMLVEYIAPYILKYARTDMLVIALLHDTIEDTELTEGAISCIFGNEVASQVQALTRIKPEGKISSAEMVKRLYEEKNYDALLVKLFDRLHNMQTIGAKSPEKIKKIVDETLGHFVTLTAYLGISWNIEKLMTMLCRNSSNESLPFAVSTYLTSTPPRLPSPIFQNDIIQKQILYLLAPK